MKKKAQARSVTLRTTLCSQIVAGLRASTVLSHLSCSSARLHGTLPAQLPHHFIIAKSLRVQPMSSIQCLPSIHTYRIL